jgi:S1-C subfamily serine protease
VDEGILVAQLYREGPALAAGVQAAQDQVIIGNRRVLVGGDIITAVDGTPITDWNNLTQYLELNTEVDQTITLSLLRDGQPMETSLTLAAQP